MKVKRGRYIDDYIRKKRLSGVKQIVFLGWGFCTRAYRDDLNLKDVNIFEIDLPEICDFKEKIISDLQEDNINLSCCCNSLNTIPFDFSRFSANKYRGGFEPPKHKMMEDFDNQTFSMNVKRWKSLDQDDLSEIGSEDPTEIRLLVANSSSLRE